MAELSVHEADAASVAAQDPAPSLGGRTRVALFVLASLLLSAWPLIPELFGHGKGKDYPLWYDVGRAVLTGGEIYRTNGAHGMNFLYPPFAAVLLAPFSLAGRAVGIVCIDLVNVASWAVAVALSGRLSGVPDGKTPWWVLVLPSLLTLPYVYDMFDLGQPNLMLLAIMLGGLALLRGRREWSAGALFAAAAALKAFPVAIFPYLLWRRRWRAAVSMALLTGVFLFLVPAPFRGFDRNLADVRTWASGMVFSASEKGFGQRPEQNWGWKNNSLIAVTHRYLRPINAEAEAPQTPPLHVNVLDVDYDTANLVVLGLALLTGVGFVAALPPERRRTAVSDGAEYGLLIALMTIASPLARAYYFVWLLFPFTVLVRHAAVDPDGVVRRWMRWLMAMIVTLFVLGAPISARHWPEALGNMFWADALVVAALAWLMRREMAPTDARAEVPTSSFSRRRTAR